MPNILLATLNARYIHSALGLRYLLANMDELRPDTLLLEFTLDRRPADIAERLLAENPRIIGLGVYIWNIEQTTRLVALLKVLSPGILIVIGGPEVSHEWQGAPIVEQADYLITGQADLAFARLCRRLLRQDPPRERIIHPDPPPLDRLTLPYHCYSDHDIAHRVVYVEASRGCPFKCEFCLSALDRTANAFQRHGFIAEMEGLLARGARCFKFVDRTFNLKLDHSLAILDFFLDRLDQRLFLHFEVIPDRLPDRLKLALQRFPAGSLQLEIGVQSLNPQVQTTISRRQDNRATLENLRWLRTETHAHLHVDLIMGLPGEALSSIADGFDQLVGLAPHEIQLGVLKRLKGTPIIRHGEAFQMRFSPNPPYEILSNDRIDFATMQRLTRFARYWDMIANSGRFRSSLPAILGEAPFRRFMQLSDWLYAATGQLHRIALQRLFELVYQGVTEQLQIDSETSTRLLGQDYLRTGIKAVPRFLSGDGVPAKPTGPGSDGRAVRQARHRANTAAAASNGNRRSPLVDL